MQQNVSTQPIIPHQDIITTTRRADDWHACITGNRALWACGRTEAEAIGRLWIDFSDDLIAKCREQASAPESEASHA